MMSEAQLIPGVNIRPVLDLDKCRDLLRDLYGFEDVEIKELNSYDDKNYKVKLQSAIDGFGDTFTLKILNSLDSKKLMFVEAQNEMMVFLDRNGIKCSKPIKNIFGKLYSLEKLTSGEHVVRLMVFIEGSIFFEVQTSPNLFYQAGKYIANIDVKLEKFHHPAYDTHTTLWMLDSLPQLRKFLYVIKDLDRRRSIEEAISEFEQRVLNHRHKLQKRIIHGDYNEQNILVEMGEGGNWQVCGVLDFGDTQKSYHLYELAIAITYMLIVGKDLDVGGYVMAGYGDVINISEFELSLLKVCVSARLCQSLVMGAYSSLQDPDNAYLLTTSAPGWELFQKLKCVPEDQLLQRWKTIAEKFNRPG